MASPQADGVFTHAGQFINLKLIRARESCLSAATIVTASTASCGCAPSKPRFLKVICCARARRHARLAPIDTAHVFLVGCRRPSKGRVARGMQSSSESGQNVRSRCATPRTSLTRENLRCSPPVQQLRRMWRNGLTSDLRLATNGVATSGEVDEAKSSAQSRRVLRAVRFGVTAATESNSTEAFATDSRIAGRSGALSGWQCG
jgi:hypothetical protein